MHVKEVTLYPDGRLDTKNASIYLGLSDKTLAMMRSQGYGPKYLKRGRIFYFKDDLDKWIMEPGLRTGTGRCANLPQESTADPKPKAPRKKS